MRIITKNSNYNVDLHSKTISGGVFGGNHAEFSSISAIVGYPGMIKLADGSLVTTEQIREVA